MKARSFKLTNELVAQHGGPIVCLDMGSVGRRYELYARRPGAEINRRLTRSEVIGKDGQLFENDASVVVEPADEKVVTMVEIRGPLEQRAGRQDVCGAWSDGHDAVAERMIAALELGDVVFVIDSPGGAAAGLQEAVRRVAEVKEQFDRRVIVYANEMIASAAYWWACGVGDEIWGPASMVVGSIGARSGHASFAGALKKDGVQVTYFVAPGPGKVAFAPEFALSDLGKERGERDIWICFETFAATVSSARGIDRKAIVNLNADMLIGMLAVDANLANGIATLEDVVENALMTTAETIQAEDEETRSEDGDDEPPADKKECIGCGAANDKDAAHCDKCGEPMSAEDDSESARTEGDPPPPKKDNAASASTMARFAGQSIAEVLGLRPGASELAIKSAAIRHRAAIEQCMRLTDTANADAMVGAVRSHVADVARLHTVESENRGLRLAEGRRERMDLLRKLAAANLPGFARGDILIDKIDAKGKRTQEPAPPFGSMKLSELRGFVDAKLSSAPIVRRSPFEPDEKAIAERIGGTASVTAADIEAEQRTGLDAKKLAESRQAIAAINQLPIALRS